MERFIGVAVLTVLVYHVNCQQQQPVPSDPNIFPAAQDQLPTGPGQVQQPNQQPNQPPPPPQLPSVPGQDPQTPNQNQGAALPHFPGQVPQQQPIPGQGPQMQHIPGQGPNHHPSTGHGQQPHPFPGQGPQPQPFPGQGPQPQPFPGQGQPPQSFAAKGQAFPGQRQGFPYQGRFPNNQFPFPQQQGPFNQFVGDPFQQNPYLNRFQPNPNQFIQSLNPLLQNQARDASQLSQFLYCQVANGTMPDWTDATCQKYWSCTNFNLSLLTCATDQAYDFATKECINSANVKCQQQNVEFWNVLQASMGGAAQPIPSFTPLSSLPGGRINITLEADACTRIGGNLPRLESVTNSALLNLSNCPFNNCNMTLITFVCP